MAVNVVSFSIVLLLGSVIRLLNHPRMVRVSFAIDTSRAAHTTDDKFLSIAIGSSLIKARWRHFDFNSDRLKALAKGLSPAYLRIGGTEADYVIFDPDDIDPAPEVPGGGTAAENPNYNHDWYMNDNAPRPFENFTLTGRDWERVNMFLNEVQWYPLFDMNALLRKGKKWDPSNAKKLLEYSARRGYQIDWQLGNDRVSPVLNPQPGGPVDCPLSGLYPSTSPAWVALPGDTSPAGIALGVTETQASRPLQEPIHYKRQGIGGSQLGKDYLTFRRLLDGFPQYKLSPLVGPEISNPRNSTLKLLRSFLGKASKALGAVTFHQYYLNGRKATLEQFIDPFYLDRLRIQIRQLLNIIHRNKPRSKVWLTETSSAYGGGAPGLSDRYVAGFMWLDKLGMAAKEKLDIVIRQTFFAGHYALVDKNHDPMPDYWLSLLYKRLVGNKVLKVVNVTSSEQSRNKIRIYAHCTKIGPIYQHSGAVTVYVMNMYNQTVELKISDKELSSTHIHQYLLTPVNDTLTSKRVLLNGQELMLTEKNELPQLNTTIIDTGKSFELPPLTFGFYVWPRANIATCKTIS